MYIINCWLDQYCIDYVGFVYQHTNLSLVTMARLYALGTFNAEPKKELDIVGKDGKVNSFIFLCSKLKITK